MYLESVSVDGLMWLMVTKRIGETDNPILLASLTGTCPENHGEGYVYDDDGGISSDSDLKITIMSWFIFTWGQKHGGLITIMEVSHMIFWPNHYYETN